MVADNFFHFHHMTNYIVLFSTQTLNKYRLTLITTIRKSLSGHCHNGLCNLTTGGIEEPPPLLFCFFAILFAYLPSQVDVMKFHIRMEVFTKFRASFIFLRY